MRSTLFYTALVLPALASVVIGVGCGSSSASFLALDGKGGPSDGEPAQPFGTTGPDASAPPTSPSRGSPLCAVATTNCMPDDDGTSHSYGTECATPLGDAGVTPTVDGGADADEAKGCRLGRKDNAYAPECMTATRSGLDGVLCANGEQCAPGFDCVDAEKGSVCRRYCCSPDSCDGHTSQNGGRTFCDIQKLVDTNPHKAPVCMPLKTCELLKDGECGPKETCAADLTKNGDTGCVATGPQKPGQQCDDEHCDEGLTCLGNPGDRRCYQLCKTNNSTCPEGQTCTTGSVFPNTAFGVCKNKP